VENFSYPGRINHKWDEPFVNAVFDEEGNIRTTQTVEAGTEIFLSYGLAYWMDKLLGITNEVVDQVKDNQLKMALEDAFEKHLRVILPDNEGKLTEEERERMKVFNEAKKKFKDIHRQQRSKRPIRNATDLT